jgi:hypothetical protein
VHAARSDNKNIVGCCAQHGRNQRTLAYCFRFDNFLLAATPNVEAAAIVNEYDLLVRLIDTNLRRLMRECEQKSWIVSDFISTGHAPRKI